MGTIEEIIKTIDNKLIESDKDYMTLGNANQLLVEKKVLSINEKLSKELKGIIEDGKIPHAYQTTETPKQWRIPLSEEGKLRKKSFKNEPRKQGKYPNYNKTVIHNTVNSNYSLKNTNCPNCNLLLIIPKELETVNYLRCLSCGCDFKNPLIFDSNNLNSTSVPKNQNNWIYGLILFFILLIVGVISTNENNSSSKVENSAYDASVSQVKRFLKKEYLVDPDSYEGIEWSKVNETDGENGTYKYWVRHKYRAKNSFGGFVIENRIFYLDSEGDVVATEIISN